MPSKSGDEEMSEEEEGKLPQYLQKQEERLGEALHNLRLAYDIAIRAEVQLRDTLSNAKDLLDSAAGAQEINDLQQ